MYSSAICRILQPAEHIMTSTVQIVRQILKGVFRKKPLSSLWAKTKDLVTFQPVFEAKISLPNHLYGMVVTLRWSEDECFYPAGLINEYIAKAKDGEEWSDKLFVTRKMSLAITASNATFASWLRDLNPSVTLQLHILLQLYAYIIIQLHIIHQRPRIMICVSYDIRSNPK